MILDAKILKKKKTRKLVPAIYRMVIYHGQVGLIPGMQD